MKRGIDDGYRICDDCDGEGKVMGLMAGPDGPIEYGMDCDSCCGDGQIEVEEMENAMVVKESRNAREGRFLGLQYQGKRLRVCPAGSDFKEAFQAWHIKLIAERHGIEIKSVRLFYGIGVSKNFTRKAAYDAFAHIGVS